MIVTQGPDIIVGSVGAPVGQPPSGSILTAMPQIEDSIWLAAAATRMVWVRSDLITPSDTGTALPPAGTHN